MLQLTPRELLIAEFFYNFAEMFRHREDPWLDCRQFVTNNENLMKALELMLEQ